MFEVPAPTHGYLPVIAAFWAYGLAVLGITVGVRELGASDGAVLLTLLIAAPVLLKLFVPVFRHLTPAAPDPR